REEFTKRIWEWRARTGGRTLQQAKNMGASPDWGGAIFTIGPPDSAAGIEALLRVAAEGLLYRAQRPHHRFPSRRPALAGPGVDSDEGGQGELYEFADPLADGSGEVVVATTRPETMLGDTAVAVHPDDPRHKAKIGKMLEHPFVDRDIPIIADAILVDPKFGTGAVKVTPAHDPNDFETGLRHQLPMISIFDEAGGVHDEGRH